MNRPEEIIRLEMNKPKRRRLRPRGARSFWRTAKKAYKTGENDPMMCQTERVLAMRIREDDRSLDEIDRKVNEVINENS